MLAYIRKRFHPLWRLRRQPWFRAFQRRVDFPVGLKYGRIRYHVMLLRDLSVVIPHGGMEAGTHRLFERLILACDVRHFFDIGANVGTFTWHALNVRPSLDVRLFEPDRTNARLLRKTIARNRLERVQLREEAVYDSVGEVSFLTDEASGAAGSITDHTSHAHSLQASYGMGARTTVRATTLDTATEGLDPEGAIIVKIDVEQTEAAVFRGGRAFFLRCRPLVIVECFETANLAPLLELDYVASPLPEHGNFLVVPRERVPALREKGILP